MMAAPPRKNVNALSAIRSWRSPTSWATRVAFSASRIATGSRSDAGWNVASERLGVSLRSALPSAIRSVTARDSAGRRTELVMNMVKPPAGILGNQAMEPRPSMVRGSVLWRRRCDATRTDP